MELINQSYEIWGRCPNNPTEALKWIEKAGRTCYNSFDKITDDSYIEFVNSIKKRGHFSVLEHSEISTKYIQNNSYGKFIDIEDNYAVGNLRSWIELYKDDENLFDKWANSEYFNIDPLKIPLNLRRYTIKIITNRAMLAELTRHRLASFSVQSQRYVRFDDQYPLTYIKPWNYDYWNYEDQDIFIKSCETSEEYYSKLIKNNNPQTSRIVLPQSTKTIIVMTASKYEWDLIFSLRCGHGADPQMIDLMNPIKVELTNLMNN
jgi:thymidylate synthase (FAD)